MVRLPNTWFSNPIAMDFNSTADEVQYFPLITVQASVVSFGHVIASVWGSAQGATTAGAVGGPIWWGIYHGDFGQADPRTPDQTPEQWLCWSVIDVATTTYSLPADQNIARQNNSAPVNDKQESRGMRRLTPQRDNCTFVAAVDPVATPAVSWGIRVRAAVRILCFQSSGTTNSGVARPEVLRGV